MRYAPGWPAKIGGVKPTPRDLEDLEFLLDNARYLRERGMHQFLHLDQPVGMWNYIRMANDVAEHVPRGRLLDWGCGLGQMTYLLKRRGFDVVAFDLGATIDNAIPEMPLTRGLNVVRGTHPTNLPFDSGSFDAVLSCGVLEHVDEYSEPGNELRSITEIHRVLRPGGHFPIFMLPQRYSWQESVLRVVRLGYSHPRRYLASEIRRLLETRGFQVARIRRSNMFPKNLTAMPSAVRRFYSRFALPILRADGALSMVPGLNQVAGTLEIIARRAGVATA